MGIVNINSCGHIGINVFMQRSLRLRRGDRLLIERDRDSRNDWYLSFGTTKQKGRAIRHLRQNRPEVGMAAEYHKKTTEEILASIGAETSASFFVALGNPKEIDGRTWYRILTSNPKFIR